MTGISSRAASSLINKKGYNGNELQNKEFSDGNGLELYDFNARTYDAQIGRFIQIDPETEEEHQDSWSPYHFSFNNPILNSDPDGRDPIRGAIKLGRIAYAIYRASDKLAALKNVKVDDIISAFSPISINQESMAKSMRDLKANRIEQLEGKSEKLQREVRSLEKSAKSLEKNVKEHEQKLEDYKSDPDKYDNKGELQNVSPEMRQQRIDGRIKSLEKQIKKNEGELNKTNKQLEQKNQELQKVNDDLKNISNK